VAGGGGSRTYAVEYERTVTLGEIAVEKGCGNGRPQGKGTGGKNSGQKGGGLAILKLKPLQKGDHSAPKRGRETGER